MSSILRNMTNRQASSPRKKEKNFAENVYQLVSAVSQKDASMIQWACDGEAFTVDSFHPDLGDALAKYFQHSKYSSFQRQLNQYGWTKPRSGRYTGTFYNPLFHRDTTLDDIRKISRGGRKQHVTKQNNPLESSTSTVSKKRPSRQVSSAPEETIPETTTSSPDSRRRPLLPLRKRTVNRDFLVPNQAETKPLTPKTIELPSAADISAVQVLLGMVRNPIPEDISSCDDSISDVGSNDRANSKNYNFAHVVHELVTEMDTNDPTMLRWVDDGAAFLIDPSHPRLGNALAKHFHHSKYSSFQRQLNQYGWRKHRNTGKYYNCLFHQDIHRTSFDLIQRKDKKNEVTNPSSSTSADSKRSRSIGPTLVSKAEELEQIDDHVPIKRRRLSSSFSKRPQLESTSGEETSSSDEDSYAAAAAPRAAQRGYCLDLTGPRSVITYLSSSF